jgi:hypothetical protein
MEKHNKNILKPTCHLGFKQSQNKRGRQVSFWHSAEMSEELITNYLLSLCEEGLDSLSSRYDSTNFTAGKKCNMHTLSDTCKNQLNHGVQGLIHHLNAIASALAADCSSE